MYKNFLIVASKKDPAGVNITTQLSQFQTSESNFKFYLVDEDILHSTNLDPEKLDMFDFIVFASKHESKAKEKTLSVHAPGNWRLASEEMGGESRKVCKTSALFMKQFFENLHSNSGQYHLKDYKITMEATHHGPLIEKPCVFVEIGATETEWNDRKAGFVLARALSETLRNFAVNPYNEISIGIGGPHYCPNFNKIQEKTNYAVSHVIPSYAFPLEEYMVKEAIDGTDEDVDFVLLDWKGLGHADHRKRVLQILDSMHLNYKKTSDIKK